MSFELIRGGDFSLASAGGGLCYVTGEKKQPGDVGIFRGPSISHEGFLDVSVRCITNAASKIGWHSPQDYDEVLRERDMLRANLKEMQEAQFKRLTEIENLKKMLAVGPDSYDCPLCDFEGTSEHSLKIHFSMKHKDEE